MVFDLSANEFRLSGGDTKRWWGHSNPTCCNQICLNFLHAVMVGILKEITNTTHAHSNPNEPPGDTFTTYYFTTAAKGTWFQAVDLLSL